MLFQFSINRFGQIPLYLYEVFSSQQINKVYKNTLLLLQIYILNILTFVTDYP